MPTALERNGDFSQSVTPSGALISVRDPVTNAQFPGNRIPANRLDPRGQALLNLYPMPNTTGVNGYNYVTQEPSIDWPRRQHMFRGDYRPTDKDSIAVKYQTFYTRSVGINVDGASARWGLVRQRYDFDVDIGKIDYTRILNTSTILEFSTGFFNSIENGPPEDDVALAGIQRATYPQLARLGQFAGQHNPLGLIPQAVFGNIQSADRAQSNDGGTAWITYDGRWPIYGNDIAINAAINLTHTRGRHTYKMGVMREDELFSQARSGTFGGQFNFADDALHPNRTGYAWANAVLGQVARYTESMGRVPDDRRQKTWAWFVQDTWKPTTKLTFDLGLRMYKWGPALAQGGEASVFSDERFDPEVGRQSACVLSASPSGHDARGAKSAKRPDPAGHVHRLDGAGNRLQLHAGDHRGHAVRDQRHRDAARWKLSRWRRRGLHRTYADSVRPASRHGVGAQSENRHSRGGRVVPRWHGRRVRAAGRRERRVPSEQDDLLHRLRLVFERRNRGISGAEYERTGADGQPAAQQPALHVGDSTGNRQERRRRCRVCLHEKQAPGSRDQHQPDPVPAPVRSGVQRPDGQRQLPRTREPCRTSSCVRFRATATSCV